MHAVCFRLAWRVTGVENDAESIARAVGAQTAGMSVSGQSSRSELGQSC